MLLSLFKKKLVLDRCERITENSFFGFPVNFFIHTVESTGGKAFMVLLGIKVQVNQPKIP